MRSTDDQVMMTPGLQWVSLMLLTRIGWAGRHWALPFLTALVPSDRCDWQKGRRHKRFTDYAQQMLDCLRRWLPDRDLVVVCDGGYAKREFLLHCQNMSNPIVVITKLRKDASPVPARAAAAAGSNRPAPGGRSATAQSHRGAGRSRHPPWIPYRATTSDGADLMIELTSGLALWYRGGFPSVHMRWVVVRHLGEPLAPQALLCTDIDADPLQIVRWYMLRWQVEVTFEELRAHLGMETQRQWSERAIARTTPALFGLFQPGDPGGGPFD